jgi:hypothetical protein
MFINEDLLRLLFWWQVIAVIIFITNGGMRNYQIEDHWIIERYLKYKANKCVPQTVGKVLSSKPNLFQKNENQEWILTQEGRRCAEEIIAKGLLNKPMPSEGVIFAL